MQILKLQLRSVRDFAESYAPELPTGGLFCPTTTEYKPGDEVLIEINADLLPNRVLVRGTVKWWRPALPRRRIRAGALVELAASEARKREFLLKALGGTAMPVRKRKHTRIPLEAPVRYRLHNSPEWQQSGLLEISTGGGLLETTTPIPLGEEITLEIVPPGGVAPMEITAKVGYHTDNHTGIKFVFRDGGGSHRLRELIRRLRAT